MSVASTRGRQPAAPPIHRSRSPRARAGLRRAPRFERDALPNAPEVARAGLGDRRSPSHIGRDSTRSPKPCKHGRPVDSSSKPREARSRTIISKERPKVAHRAAPPTTGAPALPRVRARTLPVRLPPPSSLSCLGARCESPGARLARGRRGGGPRPGGSTRSARARANAPPSSSARSP